jgi:hypothetical protein
MLLNLLKLLGAGGCRAPATRGSVGRSTVASAALGCGPGVAEALNEFLLLVGCMDPSVGVAA